MTGGGRVTVAYSASQNSSVVAMRADSAPAADRAFQFWTVRGSGAAVPVPGGVLAPGEQSAVRIVDGLPGNDAFAVSLEPAGGSRQPTDVLARVDLV
jgi:anti-sigma-K factor RskA